MAVIFMVAEYIGRQVQLPASPNTARRMRRSGGSCMPPCGVPELQRRHFFQGG
jgi:hypothetical protein